MVFHLADDDIVALTEELRAPTLRHEVDRGCRTRRKDDLGARLGSNKRPHTLARLLIEVGALLRKVVNPTMNIGIEFAVQTVDLVDHARRFLSRCATIQIDQRTAVHFTRKDRELFSYLVDVEHITSFPILQLSVR